MTKPIQSTLNSFVKRLSENPDAALVFITEGRRIQPDYHVTEVKLASVRAMDCGRKVAQWNEVLVQLIDGPQEQSQSAEFMSSKKFTSIAMASQNALSGEDDAALYFEFAAENLGMRKWSITGIAEKNGETLVQLTAVTAACKPAQRFAKSPKPQKAKCC
ncbi:MAG: DUF6428 family protein [Robiginitomaculum sp.]